MPDLDGIFFTSHVLVLPVYVRFVDRGIDVAKGQKWACIHSLPEFDVLLPDMSIAQMDIPGLGAKAMDMLIDEVNDNANQQKRVVIKCKMKLR